MTRLKKFIKEETVFCVAAVLAFITTIFVPPSALYIEYIDFRVLALLFCLMLAVAGIRGLGVFERIMECFLPHIKNLRQLVLILVLVTFFSSMWITNDVALITFIPFTILVLEAVGYCSQLITVIVLQTIAANLGSMCTPVGNPQNLYLYSLAEMSPDRFIRLMLPLTVVSLILLVLIICIVFWNAPQFEYNKQSREKFNPGVRIWIYILLFVLCLLTVIRVLDYRVLLVITVAVIFATDYRLYLKADYMLLITFAAFFIFVGNVKNIEPVRLFLEKCVGGNEVLVSVLASQVISNVPAAVLLSGFTENIPLLLVGTNIGGLGTLIASMASLISYKLYAGTKASEKGKYFFAFTVYNLIFLAVLLAVAYFW